VPDNLHYFDSCGSRCEAELRVPTARNAPVVVLAPGFGAERGFGTKGIILALVNAGIATFAFDYRGFGGSAAIRNEQRQLIDPRCQLEDWHAALRYVSSLHEVDGQRIGLWGSSFAGGHVISIAGSDWSKSFQLRAVVAQVPHCDSRTVLKNAGIKQSLGFAGNILKGAMLSMFGIHHTVPMIAEVGDPRFAVLRHPGWYEGYMRLLAPSSQWKNATPWKSLSKVASYSPIDVAHEISVPVLIVYGLKDPGVPVDDILRTAKVIRGVELFSFAGDHFDAYDGGGHHAAIVEREVNFLRNAFARTIPV